jgi:tetratricopeptide (TPR) repeat protein
MNKFIKLCLLISFITWISCINYAESRPIINQIDTLYETRNIDGNLEKSITLINETLSTEISESLTYEICWRFARQVSAAKNYLNADKKEKLGLYSRGLEQSLNAIKLQPNSINALYWHAIVLGRQAELQGILNSLSSVKPIKASMEKILQQDPKFSRGYFVLSRLYRKAPKFISIGNPKKALNNINIALKLDSNDSIYILEKSRVLIKLKKKEDAIKELKSIINLPIYANYFKDQVLRDKQEAKNLLNKLMD